MLLRRQFDLGYTPDSDSAFGKSEHRREAKGSFWYRDHVAARRTMTVSPTNIPATHFIRVVKCCVGYGDAADEHAWSRYGRQRRFVYLNLDGDDLGRGLFREICGRWPSARAPTKPTDVGRRAVHFVDHAVDVIGRSCRLAKGRW